MRTLEHIGVPVTTPQPGETYSEGMKLYLTDPTKSANKIEFLRFDSDCWMHQNIQTMTHVAYRVTDPAAEMEGKEILLPPTDCGNGNFIAFVMEDIPVELIWRV